MGYYQNYPGRPSCQTAADNFSRGLPRSPKARPKPVLPSLDRKRALTRYGVVQMPRSRNPASITAEGLLSDPSLKVVPEADLPEAARSYVLQMGPEPLPVLNPKPELTPPQLCMLQVIAELELVEETFGWSEVAHHFTRVRPNAGLARSGRKIRDVLLRKQLITSDPPRLTRTGHLRVHAQDVAEELWDRLGLKEYPIERIEPHASTKEYDLIFVQHRDGRVRQYFRHQCCEVRARAKIVVLAEP